MTAQRLYFFSHPAVIASSVHLDQPSNVHKTAMAVKMAGNRFTEDSGISTPTTSTAATSSEPDQIPTIEQYTFVFDINDVLIRDEKVIPEAIETMKLLN